MVMHSCCSAASWCQGLPGIAPSTIFLNRDHPRAIGSIGYQRTVRLPAANRICMCYAQPTHRKFRLHNTDQRLEEKPHYSEGRDFLVHPRRDAMSDHVDAGAWKINLL